MPLSRIGNFEVDIDGLACADFIPGNAGVTIGESRIAQTMSEGIHGAPRGIDVIENLSTPILTVMHWQVSHTAWPAECEFAGGVGFSKNDFGCRGAGFLAGVMSCHDGWDLIAQGM